MKNDSKNLLEVSQLLSLESGKDSWTRREFVTASLASGFALAVQPVCAQTMIVTDTKGIIDGRVRVPTKDGSIPAYVAMPAKGRAFPLILVVHEIWGVHEHIADVCRRLAKHGYMAAAPELFYRQGDVANMSSNKEILAQVVSKVPDAQVMSDLDATLAWARHMGMAHKNKLGITGFCWGGRVVWLYAAHNPSVRAAVAWYGPLARSHNPSEPTVLTLVDRIKAPVLGLYGGADAGIPNESVEHMQEALKKAGKPSVIHLYPDTPHAFHADYRPTYRKEQAADGWKRALEWFRKHGVA